MRAKLKEVASSSERLNFAGRKFFVFTFHTIRPVKFGRLAAWAITTPLTEPEELTQRK